MALLGYAGWNAITGVGSAACLNDGDCTNEIQAAGEFVDDVVDVTDKTRSVNQFLTDAQRFLGENYNQIADGVYRAENGLRQVRFTVGDILGLHDNIGPHDHFELLNSVGQYIKNIHIPFIGN